MKWMPWIMSLMFVYFGFTVPVGFSLYYTASNVVKMCIRDSICFKECCTQIFPCIYVLDFEVEGRICSNSVAMVRHLAVSYTHLECV